MSDVVLITRPPIEPVSQADLMNQLGMGTISDPTLSANLNSRFARLIRAARRYCEGYTRRAFITQTWVMRLDGFPGRSYKYQHHEYPAIMIAKPPVQSIYSLQYIDVAGELQTLLQDTSYGTAITEPQYGYQLVRGSETQPGQLIVSYPRSWPPTRLVPANVLVKFRCGYGGPLTISMAENSAVVQGATFNPDDAPLLPTETGLRVVVPGAGASGAELETTIASVDQSGIATLADKASAQVTNVSAWFGHPVPEEILQAILLHAQFYYEQGSVTDQPIPTQIHDLLSDYRNLVS